MLFLASATLVWIVWLLQLPPRPSMWLVFASGVPLVALGSRHAAARAGEEWRGFVARTLDYHAVWLVLLFALGVQMEDTHGVTTDGVIYFTQLRSVIFDRDLDVAREFAFLQQPPRPAHVVPIGPIPIWLPLYLGVAAVDTIGRALGWWLAPPNPVAIGLTTPYVRAALISSFAVGAAGVIVVHALLRREFERLAACAATILLLGGTSLFWYLVYEPAMTHAASFGVVAFFAAATARTFEYANPAIKGTVPFSAEFATGDGSSFKPASRALARSQGSASASAETAIKGTVPISAKSAILVGTLLGWAFITRPQEAVFALLPAMFLFALPGSAAERLKVAARFAGWAFVGFAPFLILQLAHSYVLFSRERLVLVGGEEGFLDPFHSRWSETLWSSWHGFLSWTPVAYLALLGTIAYARRRWPWAAAAVLILFVMAWINGSTPDLGAGWSFGGRRFVSCLVLLAPGLALLAHALIARPITAIAIVAFSAITWNLMLMTQYRTGAISRTEPVSFSEMLRRQAELYTKPPFFYPFAFPANVMFAQRTGLPIDRYDLLGPERLRSELDVTFDRDVARFFIEGWGEVAGSPGTNAWWTAASPATLVLPLALPRDHPVRFAIETRARLVEPLRKPRIHVLVNDREVGSFISEAESPSITTLSTSRDVWIDGFNRVSLVSDEPFLPIAVSRIAIRSESQ